MKIIVDCGASKADWVLGNNQARVQTLGYNPQVGDGESFINSAQRLLKDWPFQSDELVVYFYGSGQLPKDHPLTIQLLQVLFPNATFQISTDLIGACKACVGDNEGIVGILGTGSGSCIYDGKKIRDQIPSLGFAAGDEGSGAHIGKLFYQSYAYRQMPKHLTAKIDLVFPKGIKELKKQFLEHKHPNRFLANFGAQFKDELDDPFVKSIIARSFNQFVSGQLTNYSKYKLSKVHFVGSIAYHYSELLSLELEKAGLSKGKILKNPIEGLIDYHFSSEQ